MATREPLLSDARWKKSSRRCPNPSDGGPAARLNLTAWCWRPSFGSSARGRGGGICLETSVSAPARVGSDSNVGKPKASGRARGGPSSPNWMSAGAWTGARVSWRGVSLPPKRGRGRRQNQAGQGHEVGGGGRRPGCSSGRLTGQRLAARSEVGQRHPPDDLGSGPRSSASPLPSSAGHRRPGLRQRPLAWAIAPKGHALAQSPPTQPAAAFPERWAHDATVSEALETRAHFRVAGELPALGCAL